MLFAARARPQPYHAGMVDLSFDDLRLFARVAALGTLSAVARERNVPVSQISRRLQRIESAYQTRLIHRTTQGLSLTPEGQSLLAYTERILSEVDALESEFSQAGDQAIHAFGIDFLRELRFVVLDQPNAHDIHVVNLP